MLLSVRLSLGRSGLVVTRLPAVREDPGSMKGDSWLGELSRNGYTLACGARGPRFESHCGQKFVFSRKSLRYAALGTGCTLTAVPRSTQPSTLRGTVNEYQPYG